MGYFRQGYGFLGRESYQADCLTSLIRKFKPDWFKILLEETETKVRLGIKCWWGSAQVTPFWDLSFFLTIAKVPIYTLALQ